MSIYLRIFFKIKNLSRLPEDLILLVFSYSMFCKHRFIFQVTKQLQYQTNENRVKYRKYISFFGPLELDFCRYVHKTHDKCGSKILYSIILSQSNQKKIFFEMNRAKAF